ncbi:hypothetical protein GCM10027052_02540 [Parafrigoribacterium mesophilum]
MGMRSETYAALGGFDEQFELYYEDVDICERAQVFGGCALAPIEWGVHVGGASSATASTLSYCLGRISRLRYFRKRYGASWVTDATIGVIAAVEFLARSITAQSEGMHARLQSISQQWAEMRTPGSVNLLSP